MMAEYARAYGGLPAPSDSWRLFLSLVERTPMFDARARLAHLLGSGAAIGAAFGGSGDSDLSRLLERAYPVKRRSPRWIRNAFGAGGIADA